MGCTSSKHELSKEDLEFLKTHTSYSEKKIKTWYKGFMVYLFILFFIFSQFLISLLQRDCPNGELTRDSFIQIYKQFFPKGRAENFCEHVFRAFDTGKLEIKKKRDMIIVLFNLIIQIKAEKLILKNFYKQLILHHKEHLIKS